MANALIVTDLHKSYGAIPALKGIVLSVNQGELYGLIGPDGAGKTTLLRIVCGLLRADSGSATLFDLAVDRENQKIRKLLGYMPQRFSLYPDLTVEENLKFFSTIYGVGRKLRRERTARLLQFSRLGPFAHRRAHALSGGMKQKLALSCTLIHQPAILLLDEPTTGVDPLSRREFWAILAELKAEGVTIVVSTPYMDEAGKCDRIAFIHRGSILAVDTPRAIPLLFPYKIVAAPQAQTPSFKEATLKLPGVIAVKTFGDRVHITTHDPELVVAGVHRWFVEHGVQNAEVVEIKPGLEDTFMSLMEKHS